MFGLGNALFGDVLLVLGVRAFVNTLELDGLVVDSLLPIFPGLLTE